MKDGKLRKMRIEVTGDAPWGTHFCLFYQTKEDLIDILVPYFKAGLENNEFCMWVTSEPLNVEDAERASQRVVKNLDDYIESGQIEILDYSQWYTKSGRFDADEVLQGWVEKEAQAAKRGFDGLRLTGNTFWLEERDWEAFTNYEAEVDRVIGQYRMLAICTYSLDRCRASEVIDVVSNHEFALIKREGKWETIESARRKRAEEALQASARQWRTTFDAISDGVWLADREGRILRCNEAMTKLLGKPFSEVVGRPCWELVHGTSEPIEGCPFKRMGETCRRETLVLPIGERWLDDAVDPLLDEDGNLVGAVHVMTDITERKRAEEALRESELRFSTVFHTSPIGISITRLADGQYIDVNEAFLGLFGYAREEALSHTSLQLQTWAFPEDRGRVVKMLREQGRVQGMEAQFRRKSGGIWTGLFSAAVIDIASESYTLVLLQDITERKRAEKALQQSERELSIRNRIAEIFLTTPDDEMYGEMLQLVLEVTESKYGLFGYIGEDGALVCPSLTRDVWDRCQIPDKDIVFPRQTWGGLWGYALMEKKILYSNKPFHVPEGHIPILRALDVPIIHRREVIGNLLVGNKATDYDKEDCALLEAIANYIAPILHARLQEDREERERKQAEEALRESERRLKEAQAMGRIGDWKFDIDNQKITWSDQVFKLYERDPGWGAPTPEEEATYYSPEQARILREYARRSIETGEEFEYDLEAKLPSGRTGYFSACMHPIKDESGRVVELFGTVQDITERKRAEEAVRRHLERAEALREIDRAITSTLDLPGVLDIILEELERVIPYHSAGIFLFSDGTARLTAGRGFPDLEHVLQVSFPVQEDALTREVLQQKCPLVLADAQTDERFLARGDTGYVRSWIGVPLIAKGRALGFLTVDHREPGVYDEQSAEIAQRFASQAAIAIENARLYHESQRRAEQIAALREVNLATLSTLEREQVFEIMLDQLGRVIDHDTAAIKIITPDGRDKMIAGRGPIIYDQPMWNGFDVKDNKLVQEMKETRQPVVVNDAYTDDRYARVGDWEAFRSWAGAPLFVRGDFIGHLAVEKTSPGFYDEATAQLLGDFAHAAAIALENARLYEDIQRELAERKRAEEELQYTLEKLRKTLGGIIQAMALTVETRDPYTAGHQRRVSNLARAIADEMGLSEEEIDGIRIAGTIHDVGKINVPAEILSKPGTLSDLEYGLIKAHPQISYDILRTIDFPWPVAQIVLQHHERLDGSGYPQGLSGEEILLEARVLAVADVVEAMASYRPYRPSRGLDKALEEISQNKGVLYDAEVVDACLKLFMEKGFTFE
jgi:PAS domain S-box-containing protein